MPRGSLPWLLLGLVCAGPPDAPPAPAVDPVVARLRGEAEALRPLLESELAQGFLDATAHLPAPPARTIFRDGETRRCYAPDEAAELPPEDRAVLERVELEPASYYDSKYGTPLAFGRVVDLLGRHGLESLEGRRVLDFGYGSVGHLHLMAILGASATGVDVDTFLTALYAEPTDQGAVARPGGPPGAVRLLHGRWPAEPAVRASVGGGFDVFVSKNTLKRGYVHPEREVDPRMLVHLGVEDDVYVAAILEAMRPGGLVIIYNLSPAPSAADEPYKPWADGRCPFERPLLEQAGFEVLAYEVDDTAFARDMGRALGWDRGGQGMDLERDLFAQYTILRRPAR